MDKKEIIQDLLIDFKVLKPDLQKFDGNPAPAMAERLIIIINKMTEYAHFFDDEFKIAIKRYIIAYEAARKNESGGENIFELVKPTTDLIEKTLMKMNN